MSPQSTIEQSYQQFIQTVCKTQVVYGLATEEGFASAPSNEYDDEDGNPVEIICFWSEKALAAACVKEEWGQYQPTEMPLAELMENWCIGMNNDGLLVGTNFDENLAGYETEPLELILELISELRKNNSPISFINYESMDELEKKVIAVNK